MSELLTCEVSALSVAPAAMEIDFDRAKSRRNLAERGFDFAFAARVFLGPATIFEDTRRDYGEVRMIAIGEIDGALYKVVFTDRAAIRRISANRASRQEKRLWHPSG